MSEIEKAALKLQNWAINEGLFNSKSLQSYAAVAGAEEPAEEPFTALAGRILKSRKVEGFGVNEKSKTIYVYISSQLTKKQLKEMPDKIDGFAIAFALGGQVISGPPSGIPPSAHTRMHKGRYCCGNSIILANQFSAGTFGCLVKDKEGQLYGLSNNHVTAGCSNADLGFPILAPSPVDVKAGSINPFTIGINSKALQLYPGNPEVVSSASENSDAAIFQILNPDMVTSMQGGLYDTPAKVAKPNFEMPVRKFGRSTGDTKGIIRTRAAGMQPVSYKTKDYHFVAYFPNVWIVEGIGGPFCTEGDSGALVVHESEAGGCEAVGIVFGGDGRNSYILPLSDILARLEVSIVSNHNC